MLNLSIGNKKLVPGVTENGEKVKFLIWNLPAKITCPCATEKCLMNCYADKAERLYPSVLPSRMKNLEDAKSVAFAENMLDTIAHYMGKKSFRDADKVYFRIHESGDFFNQRYVDMWIFVINTCKDLYPNLVFVAYTKSFRFFANTETVYAREKYPNFSLVASVWADTDPAQLALIEKLQLPIYTAETAEKVEQAVSAGIAEKCTCRDCKNCALCFKPGTKKNIYCVIH